MSEQTDGIIFSVTSGFGANQRQPYVQVLIEAADFMTQMPPATARDLAMNLLTAADAAESDGFLMTFLQEYTGVTEVASQAQILYLFREYRDKQRKGPDDAHHPDPEDNDQPAA